MTLLQLTAIGAVLSLAACGQPNPAPVEQAPPARTTQAPSTDPGAVYPSLEGDPAPTSGAEGGRGSAQTGATDGAKAPQD